MSGRFPSYGMGIPGLDSSGLPGWLFVLEGTDGAGRSTHVQRLRLHLERLGYGVGEAGLNRSDLAQRGIRRAKRGNTLGSNAYNLFYATDYADLIERHVVPMLRAGFVVLSDRYMYSLIARAVVRGADRDWIRQVLSFSLVPDAVYYLRVSALDLVPRMLLSGGFDYWESGMDLPMGEDLYDSFVCYQQRLIGELDAMSTEFGFTTIDATRPVNEVSADLCADVTRRLQAGRDARPRPLPPQEDAAPRADTGRARAGG